GDYCLEKGKLEFAIEVFSALDNKAKLLSIGEKCFAQKDYIHAARAYELGEDLEKLNRVGEEFMKIGLLANALRAYQAAKNEMMVQFIKENFAEKDLITRVYV
ncbi:MAG: hypothetical protein AABW52_04905, partial [Nanoarchaeota archaeon]